MIFRKIIFSILLVSMTTKLLGGFIFFHEFKVASNKSEVSAKSTSGGLLVSFELLGLKLESDTNTEISKHHFLDNLFSSKLFSLITTVTTNISYDNIFSIPTTSKNCTKQAFYQTFRI